MEILQIIIIINIKKYYNTADIFLKTFLYSENNECLKLNVVHPVCRVLICVCMRVGVKNVTTVRVIYISLLSWRDDKKTADNAKTRLY